MGSFDCAIVGGGMIGAACALSLAQQGLSVALIEQHSPADFNSEQPYDLRVSAISLASEHLLAQLNVWELLSKERICPYKRLGVWEIDNIYTEFNSADIHQSHLGHIIENRLLQGSLWQEIDKQSNIKLFCPEKIISLEESNDEVKVELSTQTICVKLLIGADGANSKVRALANIGITGWDYQHSAMLINIKSSIPQQDITWQKYLPTGPVAFLPLQSLNPEESLGSLVWYHQKDEIKRLSQLSNETLTQEIRKTFPEVIGDIKVLNKGAFPLTRRHANQYVNSRILLIGDAAHTINPMAGQGVNLGFKDVKALERVIATAIGNGEKWDSSKTLKEYERVRRKDNLMMMSGMDMLYHGFNHPSPLIKGIRSLAFLTVNKLPLLKNKALAYACGI